MNTIQSRPINVSKPALKAPPQFSGTPHGPAVPHLFACAECGGKNKAMTSEQPMSFKETLMHHSECIGAGAVALAIAATALFLRYRKRSQNKPANPPTAP